MREKSGCKLIIALCLLVIAIITGACKETRDKALNPASVASSGSNTTTEMVSVSGGNLDVPFYIGKYEVTNKEYVMFLNDGNVKKEFDPNWIDIKDDEYCGIKELSPGKFTVKTGYENRPMVYVSWDGAIAYCNWLSKGEGLSPAYTGSKVEVLKNGYRLPDKDEWEYAYKAGKSTTFYWGDKPDPNYCWCKENSGGNHHEAGQKKPNDFGLYDIAGNAGEWCSGTRGEKSYHWCTGGSFLSPSDDWNLSWRQAGGYKSNFKSNYIGFRIVKSNIPSVSVTPSDIILTGPAQAIKNTGSAPEKINIPELEEAIKKGDINKIRELIEKDPEIVNGIINYPCEYYSFTPLHITIKNNNKEIAELLIKYGADVNGKNNSYQSPLHFAAQYNRKEIAELLMKNGADVNARGDISQTPLHTAALYNSKDVAEVLIANKAALNGGDYFCGCHRSGNTPLHYAVWKNSKEVAELLIEKGANINQKNYGGDQSDTPLYTAVKCDEKEMFDLLLRKGADVSDLPLHYAVYEGEPEKVKSLLDKGLNVNTKSFSGETSLYHVRDSKIAEYLLSKGAGLKIRNYDGYSPLHVVKTPEIAKLFISKGADVNAKSSYGSNPLHMAHNREIAEILINNGANINVKGDRGCTPLHWFSRTGKREMVELLISKGADINAKDEDNITPLHIALEEGQNDVVKLLIKSGADVNVQKKVRNEYPLHIAADKGNKEICELLLDRGAKIDVKDYGNSTPLYYAIYKGNKELAELFIKRGAKPYLEDGRTPLHCVRTLELAEYFIAKGFDVKARNKKGATPLHSAATLEIAKLFISKGADVNGRDNDNSTPLHNAATVEIADLFISKGADVNAIDKSGFNPLYNAVYKQDINLLKFLISKGARVDIKPVNNNDSLLAIADRSVNSNEIVELLIQKGAEIPERLGKHLLHKATDAKIVKILLSKGVYINVQDYDDLKTPLQSAIKDGRAEVVEFLIKNGADFNGKDKYGATPLHYAVRYNQPDTVRLLIASGADVNIRDNQEKTPLYLAEKEKKNEIVKILTEKGAKKEASSISSYDFSALVSAGKLDDVREVIKKQPDIVNKKDTSGFTPLLSAALHADADLSNKTEREIFGYLTEEEIKTQIEMIKLFISAGADVTASGYRGYTPLHMVHNKKELAMLFVNKGADVNAKNEDGETPLFHCRKGDLAEFLISKGAKVNIKNKSEDTPLHIAGEDCVEILIKSGADVNAKNNRGETPLFNTYGQEKKAELLVKNGAAVNIKNNRGETPLDRAGNMAVEIVLIKNGADGSKYPFHYALLMEDMEKVKDFLKKGVDVNKVGGHHTPIEYAVYTGNIKLAELLINNGADIIQNNPLPTAVAWNRLEMAEFLIKKGADVNIRDDFQGYTPLDYAKSDEMRTLLIKHGAKESGIPTF